MYKVVIHISRGGGGKGDGGFLPAGGSAYEFLSHVKNVFLLIPPTPHHICCLIYCISKRMKGNEKRSGGERKRVEFMLKKIRISKNQLYKNSAETAFFVSVLEKKKGGRKTLEMCGVIECLDYQGVFRHHGGFFLRPCNTSRHVWTFVHSSHYPLDICSLYNF